MPTNRPKIYENKEKKRCLRVLPFNACHSLGKQITGPAINKASLRP